jgi:mono/diheme cytochrome c family protein
MPALARMVVLAAAAIPAVPGAADLPDAARMKLGRQVFTQIAQPPCGLCHTLADAGTKGEIGAKLEEVMPDEARVRNAVRQGSGVMPRYDDKLTPEQIDAVAYYVAQALRRAK